MNEKSCKNCRKHDNFTCVCFNGDSKHCADFTGSEFCCEFWEGKEDGKQDGKQGDIVPMSELSELINRGGLIDDFKIEKSKDEPPTQPIKLADWLIDRGLKDGIRLYGKNDLRKIANYLLIYCGDEND